MSLKRCTCKTKCGWEMCPIHVQCDEEDGHGAKCRALRDPIMFDEVEAALVHWRDHTYLGGCAHGR